MMKRLLLMAAVLVLASAAPALAQKSKVKNKEIKTKEKRFETVVRESPADYAGRYEGFEAGYYIEIRVDSGNSLSGTSIEGDRRAELQNIKLEQGRLTATKVYSDGTRGEFTATFSNRILNGVTNFGMVIEGSISVAPGVTYDRVFYRRD